MFVRRLVLNNFRCYQDIEAEFNNEKIYITGDNGIGKTSILEAIYYLTIGRSFRKADNSDLIRKGQKEASIYLEYHSDKENRDHHLSCVIGKDYKLFAFDDEKVSSLSKILRKLLAVYYTPSLVFFFQDEPEIRRKLLDETLSQFSPQYLYAISRYKKLLKERNTALQRDYDSDVIDVLRNELINLSYRIVIERKNLIKKLSPKAAEYYNKLFGTAERKFSLSYKTNCPLDEDQESFVKNALQLFERNKSVENIKKVTAIGPHRDDLSGLLNGNPLAGYGSQGENHLASLSLKLAILDEYKHNLGDTPILLLDDITSDLDDIRCNNLLQLIKNENQQVFITGTTIRDGFLDYTIFVTDSTKLTRR
jgi:DNA replication and repair protein recF